MVAALSRDGQRGAEKDGGYRPRVLIGEHRAWLLRRIASGSDMTLRGLVAELAEQGVKVSYRTVWNFVHREKISYKKSVLPAEQNRPGVARHRARWKRYQDKIDPKRLVFIDETWVKTNMAPLRGWCARGKRLVARVPYGHWKTSTFVAALRCGGIEAPCVFDGPINSARFLAYVEQCLIPTLRPGDIVSLDNLGSHKSKAVRDAIRAAGAKRIFLPAYSPDLNPIEQVFAKLKHLMRKAGERTIDATWNRLGTSLDHFSPQECANYFRNAGYAS